MSQTRSRLEPARPPRAGTRTIPARPGPRTPVPIEDDSLVLDSARNRRIVDGVRALGILLVVFFHVLFGLTKVLPQDALDRFVADCPAIFNIGWQALGSEVIFLLSGFLLSYLLLRELSRTDMIDMHEYLVRRMSRILPLYAVGLVLFASAAKFSVGEAVLNLLFVSAIFDVKTIIPVGWSLELLVQMYVFLPFVVLGVMRSGRPLSILAGLLVASVAVRSWALVADPVAYETPFHVLLHGADALDTQQDLYYLLWFRSTPFLVGLLVAYLTIHRARALETLFARRGAALSAGLLGIALIVASGFQPIHDAHSFLYRETGPGFWLWFWTLQRPVFTAGLALLLTALWFARSGPVRALARVLEWRVWGLVSRNIYSIYMFHIAWILPAAVLVFWTIDKDAIQSVNVPQVLAIFALGATFSVLFASVLTRFVEAPSQRWIRRRY